MPTLPTGLTRDQFALALYRLNPAYAYRFLDNGGYEWRGTESDPQTAAPTDAAITAAWQAQDAAQQQAATDDQTRRQAVVSQVQALVGVKFTDMTAAQRQTLIAALAYKLNAIDKTLAVRPLAEWL